MMMIDKQHCPAHLIELSDLKSRLLHQKRVFLNCAVSAKAAAEFVKTVAFKKTCFTRLSIASPVPEMLFSQNLHSSYLKT